MLTGVQGKHPRSNDEQLAVSSKKSKTDDDVRGGFAALDDKKLSESLASHINDKTDVRARVGNVKKSDGKDGTIREQCVVFSKRNMKEEDFVAVNAAATAWINIEAEKMPAFMAAAKTAFTTALTSKIGAGAKLGVGQSFYKPPTAPAAAAAGGSIFSTTSTVLPGGAGTHHMHHMHARLSLLRQRGAGTFFFPRSAL